MTTYHVFLWQSLDEEKPTVRQSLPCTDPLSAAHLVMQDTDIIEAAFVIVYVGTHIAGEFTDVSLPTEEG